MINGGEGLGKEPWRRKVIDLGSDLGKKAARHGKDRARDASVTMAVEGGRATVLAIKDQVHSMRGKRRFVPDIKVLGFKLIGECQSCTTDVGTVKAEFQIKAFEAVEWRRTAANHKPVLVDLHSLADEMVNLVLDRPWPPLTPIPEPTRTAINRFRDRLNDLDEENAGNAK